MNKNLKNIIKQIEYGEITYLDGFSFTLEEYLSKDENNISFMEYLLKNDITIFDDDEIEKIKYSKEIAYLYSKYGYNLYDFKLTEEDLFSIINGEILIERFMKDHIINSEMINCIKENTKIIDLIAPNKNNYYLLNGISPEITKKLLEKDSNNKLLIENYFNNNDLMAYLIPKINNKEIINLCKKHNKENYLKWANENLLMSVNDQNKTLLDELLEKNIIPTKLNSIPQNGEFITLLIQKNLIHYLKNTSEETLLTPLMNNMTLLDFLLYNNHIPNIKSIHYEQTIKILYKFNKLDLATNISEHLLEEPVKKFFDENAYQNKTLLEYMLDQKYNPLQDYNHIYSVKLIKILCKYEKYNLLSKLVHKNNLLIKINDNTTLLEKFLQDNYDIKIDFSFVNKKEIASLLLKYKRFDLLVKMPLDILMMNAENKKSFFENILCEIKNDKFKYNLNKIYLENVSNAILVKFYILIAKLDMMNYIKNITINMLLKINNKKTLLDDLLEKDSDLTLNKIIPDRIKRNPKIALILSSKGHNQKEIDIIEEDRLYGEEHLKEIHNKKSIGPITYEADTLLKKLEMLFIADKKSDPKLIDALICGYRMSLIRNYNKTIKELKKLIEIKEQNLDNFIYNRSNDGSYFESNSIFCDYAIIETLFHETGHALHNYITNYDLPNGYEKIIENSRNNPKTLKQTEKFANYYRKCADEIKQLTEEYYLEFANSYYTKEKLKNIKEYLINIKKQKKEELKDLNITDKEINKFLDKTYTIDNYIKHEKRRFKSEIKEILMENIYPKESAISDILDAVYEGKLKDGILRNTNGDFIPKSAGHGMEYYYGTTNDFDEMIANLSNLIKDYNSNESLETLKSIIGEELFNLIYNFYYENFINKKEIYYENTKHKK